MKKILVLVIVAGVMWVSSAEVGAVDYYVDATGGNDSWNGNYPNYEGGMNGPWKTIARVNDYAENPRFSDGDAICFKRGEVWRNDETIGYDTSTIYWGTLNGLTIQDYGTGEKPWIDGSSQAAICFHGYDKLSNLVIRNIDVSGLGWVGAPETANIYVRNVTNITIDNIYADGHKGTPTEFVVKGPIKIGPNLGDLVIKNCEIFNIMQRDTLNRYGSPYTIVINNYHVSANAKITGSVKIINNTVHDVVGDILQPANVRPPGGLLIADNVFYHFGENAIDLKSCSNVIIENNEIYRDFGGSNKYCEDYWPDHLFNFGMIVTHTTGGGTDPTCENIIIRNNYIHSAGNFRTFEIGGANNLQIYDNYFKDVGRIELSTNRCSVHNNVWDVTHDPVCDDFIYCTSGTTSCSASTLSLIAPSSYMRSCKIFNNTFYTKSNTMNYGMYYKKYSTSVNNEIFNNIFYFDRDDTNSYPLYFKIRDDSSDIPDVHNNLYFNPSGTKRIYWDGTIYDSTDQTAWQDAGHPGGIFTDPLFVDPENSGFHLQSTSPMIDTGVFLTTITSNTASSQTSFTVVDAGCFYDGWGIPGEVGNTIKTQNGQTTTVQTVDYDTNTITVNPAINIVNNEGIALNYEGTAPDIGAYEYAIRGDLNGDGCVDITDLSMFVEFWLQCNDPQNPDCEFPY
ncbi:MAG: hypothetical protein KAT56_02490 [Sedimentisphaerales bacterium]|nr:hypothetical protein [Sedimentisphaerales bacterium]